MNINKKFLLIVICLIVLVNVGFGAGVESCNKHPDDRELICIDHGNIKIGAYEDRMKRVHDGWHEVHDEYPDIMDMALIFGYLEECVNEYNDEFENYHGSGLGIDLMLNIIQESYECVCGSGGCMTRKERDAQESVNKNYQSSENNLKEESDPIIEKGGVISKFSVRAGPRCDPNDWEETCCCDCEDEYYSLYLTREERWLLCTKMKLGMAECAETPDCSVGEMCVWGECVNLLCSSRCYQESELSSSKSLAAAGTTDTCSTCAEINIIDQKVNDINKNKEVSFDNNGNIYLKVSMIPDLESGWSVTSFFYCGENEIYSYTKPTTDGYVQFKVWEDLFDDEACDDVDKITVKIEADAIGKNVAKTKTFDFVLDKVEALDVYMCHLYENRETGKYESYVGQGHFSYGKGFQWKMRKCGDDYLCEKTGPKLVDNFGAKQAYGDFTGSFDEDPYAEARCVYSGRLSDYKYGRVDWVEEQVTKYEAYRLEHPEDYPVPDKYKPTEALREFICEERDGVAVRYELKRSGFIGLDQVVTGAQILDNFYYGVESYLPGSLGMCSEKYRDLSGVYSSGITWFKKEKKLNFFYCNHNSELFYFDIEGSTNAIPIWKNEMTNFLSNFCKAEETLKKMNRNLPLQSEFVFNEYVFGQDKDFHSFWKQEGVIEEKIDKCGEYCADTIPNSVPYKSGHYCKCVCEDGYKLAVNGDILKEEKLTTEQMLHRLEQDRTILFHDNVEVGEVQTLTLAAPNHLVIAGVNNAPDLKEKVIRYLYGLPKKMSMSFKGIIIYPPGRFEELGFGNAFTSSNRIMRFNSIDFYKYYLDHEAAHNLHYEIEGKYSYTRAAAKYKFSTVTGYYFYQKYKAQDKLGTEESDDEKLRQMVLESDKFSDDEKNEFYKKLVDYHELEEYLHKPLLVDSWGAFSHFMTSAYVHLDKMEEEIKYSVTRFMSDYGSHYKLWEYMGTEFVDPDGDAEFIKKWEEIAGDVYDNTKTHTFDSGKSSTVWSDWDGVSSLFQGVRPKYGLWRTYGGTEKGEDIATFIEAFTSQSNMFKLKKLIDPESIYYTDISESNAKKWADIYKKKLDLLYEYDFISDDDYNFVTGTLSCESEDDEDVVSSKSLMSLSKQSVVGKTMQINVEQKEAEGSGSFYEIKLKYNNGDISIESIEVKPVTATEVVYNLPGSYVGEVLDENFNSIDAVFFDIPVKVRYSYYDEELELWGHEEEELQQVETIIKIPYHENAHKIRIFDKDIEIKATIDLEEPEEVLCTDSDETDDNNGIDAFTLGVVNDIAEHDSYDFCDEYDPNGKGLYEYYCVVDENGIQDGTVNIQLVQCNNGCVGGKCNPYSVCDDTDDDNICDNDDNCPSVSNPGQENKDNDAKGDACEICDNEEELFNPSAQTELICNDGIDNDCDNTLDMQDSDCSVCDNCGIGITNVCDQDECLGLEQGCYFDETLLNIGGCLTCSSINSCESYDTNEAGCTQDVCNKGDCLFVDNNCCTKGNCGDEQPKLTVTSNKNKYDLGEDVVVSIVNNFNEDVFYSGDFYRLVDDEWIKINNVPCDGCNSRCLVKALAIKPGETVEFAWDQKEEKCVGEGFDAVFLETQVPSGEYKVLVVSSGNEFEKQFKIISTQTQCKSGDIALQKERILQGLDVYTPPYEPSAWTYDASATPQTRCKWKCINPYVAKEYSQISKAFAQSSGETTAYQCCECLEENKCHPENGNRRCDGCNYVEVENLVAETNCDGQDDDCDNLKDEGCGCIDNTFRETICGKGLCVNRIQQTCMNGEWLPVCSPKDLAVDEQCNGIDEDCDGVDDGNEGLTQQCGETNIGECRSGTQNCVRNFDINDIFNAKISVLQEFAKGSSLLIQLKADNDNSYILQTLYGGKLQLIIRKSGKSNYFDSGVLDWNIGDEFMLSLKNIGSGCKLYVDDDVLLDVSLQGGCSLGETIVHEVFVNGNKIKTIKPETFSYGECINAQAPVDEFCNGKDDDCNNIIDNLGVDGAAHSKCVCGGVMPSGNVVKGPSTYIYGYSPVIWTYRNTPSVHSACHWKCADGYEKNENTCVKIPEPSCVEPVPSGDGIFIRERPDSVNQEWVYDELIPFASCSWRCDKNNCYAQSGDICVKQQESLELNNCNDDADNDCDGFADTLDEDCCDCSGNECEAPGDTHKRCNGCTYETVQDVAKELECDGKDEDCDGIKDEGYEITKYQDHDGDGFGDPESAVETTVCSVITLNLVDNADDCDDISPQIYPGSSEICDNEIDDDCDGLVDALDDDCVVDDTVELKLLLHKGWNVMPLTIEPDVVEIDKVLASVMDNVVIIREYGADDVYVFDPKIPARFNSLKTISGGKAYQIKMKDSVELTISGAEFDNKKINLHKGWNMMPYLGGSILGIDDVIGSVKDNIVIIREYGADDVFVYDPKIPARFNSLKEFKPETGYQIKMKDKGVVDFG